MSNDPTHLPTDDDDYISEDGSGSDDVSSNRLKYHKEEEVIYPLPVFCSQPAIHKDNNVSILKYLVLCCDVKLWCKNLKNDVIQL